MGKRSQEKHLGLTEEQRMANPRNLNNKVDVLRLQKQRNKQNKAIRNFMKALYNTDRIGKVFTTSDKSK